jgi:hypothetical protein
MLFFLPPKEKFAAFNQFGYSGTLIMNFRTLDLLRINYGVIVFILMSYKISAAIDPGN